MHAIQKEYMMNGVHTKYPVTKDKYDAVLFDLDGVVTKTAKIHAACWKTTFDVYLEKRSVRTDETFRPFDIATDYLLYVDGKPRYNGVRDFLQSRNIILPEGSLDDPSQTETVYGLGNRKNELVEEAIETDGVDVYEGALAFLEYVRGEGISTAVVTSSQKCHAVLQAAGIEDFFEVEIDGNTIVQQQLAGKPAPDSFLKAAQLLDVQTKRAVVIEDAISGVQAGVRGCFGLVIGVARKDNAEELKIHGAHIVVTDLRELVP